MNAENSDNFGREFRPRIFGGGPEALNKQGKNHGNNLPSKFAEKFAGNFPKICQGKIKNSPQIRSAEPWDQRIAAATAEKRAALVHSAEASRKLLFSKPAPA